MSKAIGGQDGNFKINHDFFYRIISTIDAQSLNQKNDCEVVMSWHLPPYG